MLQKTYRVQSFDVSPDGRIRISALQKYMQQLAREDCAEYGATYEAMRDRNMVFVITKLGIEFYEDINSEDIITIKTFHNVLEGVHFNREYIFYKGGAEVGRASTFWVLLNFATRRVLRPKYFDYPMHSHDLPISLDIPRRLYEPTEGDTSVGTRRVMYSDLDQNGHLNNCVYSDIALDFIPDFGKNTRINKAEIIFLSEALEGDELELFYHKDADFHYISAHNKTTDNLCFMSRFGV